MARASTTSVGCTISCGGGGDGQGAPASHRPARATQVPGGPGSPQPTPAQGPSLGMDVTPCGILLGIEATSPAGSSQGGASTCLSHGLRPASHLSDEDPAAERPSNQGAPGQGVSRPPPPQPTCPEKSGRLVGLLEKRNMLMKWMRMLGAEAALAAVTRSHL